MEPDIRYAVGIAARCQRGHTIVLRQPWPLKCPECQKEDDDANAARRARLERLARAERRRERAIRALPAG